MEDKTGQESSLSIRELNSAIKVLLENKDQESEHLKKSVEFNINTIILPYIQKLKQTSLDDMQLAYLDIIESNLQHIVSSSGYRVNQYADQLTKAENQLVDLILDGRTSKEIAELLGISKRTVDTHRRSIRKKLGIANKKVNLVSFLMTLQ